MSAHLEVPQTPRAKRRFDEDEGTDVASDISSAEQQLKVRQEGDKSDSGSLDAFRRLSLSSVSDDGRPASALGYVPGVPSDPRQEPWRQRFSARCQRFWARNRPVLLVAGAQLFGALMNMFARLLELDGQRMHPFQILFIRMGLTTIVSLSYMWWKSVPHSPLGRRDVRWLLVVRGTAGFFGLYGMWYSMMYLPLAEATVITFLVPSVAGYLCHVLLHDPFTRKEQIASFISLAGVVLIARPTSLFSTSEAPATAPTPAVDVPSNMTAASPPSLGEDASPAQRLTAIGVALLGVLGGSGAFTSIRWIGTRAHPLISVNYFSTSVFIVSTSALALGPVLDIAQPDMRFGLPHGPRQWLFLLFICVCGFITQFLITAGLGAEKSNRATVMVYTHMLFAASFDKWVFGHEMGPVSLVGCGLIIGSALWVIFTKKEKNQPMGAEDLERFPLQTIEATPMLRPGADGDASDDEESEEEDEVAEGTDMGISRPTDLRD